MLQADPTPAIRTFRVVATPITTITEGPGTLNPEGVLVSKQDTAAFEFAADQPGSTYECSLDEGGLNPGEFDGFFPCTSPVAYFGLEDGEHTFEVRATNPQGGLEEPPALYEWFVELGPDTVAPDTRITLGPAASDPLSVATFEFTGTRQPRRAAHVRVRARRLGLQLLHVAGGVLRPRARPARAAGPRPSTPPATATRRRRATSGSSSRRR